MGLFRRSSAAESQLILKCQAEDSRFRHAKLGRQSEETYKVWRTEITSTGYSKDLRTVFPVMVAASSIYIGENTGKMVQLEMYDDDAKRCDGMGRASELWIES